MGSGYERIGSKNSVQQVAQHDPQTGLYPFMLAASADKSSRCFGLGTIFEMVKHNPELTIPRSYDCLKYC